ncbi:MAG TPA: hypothetical protein DEH25_15685 [Chloroflexi bacterium]|nr:hypothetical protein [Chloroflexota bacterium]HBY07527.1 hypothetical protein [Chloroflexota bacterium]
MNKASFTVGLVGVCGSGKTTLTNRLKPYGFNVRQIAQEHSFVPDMWQRLANPDVLIFLEASYTITLQRKPFNWSEAEYQEQLRRLRHAREHADIHIITDELSPAEVLAAVLDFLGEKPIENRVGE